MKFFRILNTEIISFDEVAQAYSDFNNGIAKKFVIDPHKVLDNRETFRKVVQEAGPSSLGRDAKWP